MTRGLVIGESLIDIVDRGGQTDDEHVGGSPLNVAVGLSRGRRWSRTPAALTQLFVGIVGIYLVQGHRYAWGIPSLVLAKLIYGLLKSRSGATQCRRRR